MPGSSQQHYVIHHHLDPRGAHFDYMFEQPEGLATFRAACPLNEVTSEPLAIERIGQHRRAYLDYEGPVSSNRGTVHAVERGQFTWLRRDNLDWLIQTENAAPPRSYRIWRDAATTESWQIRRES